MGRSLQTLKAFIGYQKVRPCLLGNMNVHSIRLRAAGDGVYSVFEDDQIKLIDLKTNTTRNLVARSDVRNVGSLLWWIGGIAHLFDQAYGGILNWFDWQISPDMRHILFKTDYQKVCVSDLSAMSIV